MMKKTIFYLMIGLLTPLLAACGSDEAPVLVDLSVNKRDSFTDARDANTYHYVSVGGLDWMTDNLRYDTGDDNTRSIYATQELPGDNGTTTNARTVARYGYLYSYEGALTAAPAGWRLPTDEDWKRLETALGMTREQADGDLWRGNGQAEVLNSATGLNLLYAGFHDKNSTSFAQHFFFMGAVGYYWTATSPAEGLALFRKIRYNSGQVYRHTTKTNNMLSVRCVRDAN